MRHSLMEFVFLCFGSGQLLANQLVPVALICDKSLFDGIEKYNEELSGVKCFPGSGNKTSCFVVADEKKGLQQIAITAANGKINCKPGPVLAKKRGLSCLKGKKPERDFEAVASDGKYLFITGSWGNRRKGSAAKSPERWALIRQKLASPGTGAFLAGKCKAIKRKHLKTILKTSLPSIDPFADKPLQCGGLNIEGLAVLEKRLYFGLRSPSDVPTAGIMLFSLPPNALFAQNYKTLRAKSYHLHLSINGVDQTGLGVRALEPLGKHRLLIVTGPAGVGTINLNEKGVKRIADTCGQARRPFYQNHKKNVPFALWLWTPKTGRIIHIGTIGGKYKTRKLEGIAVLSNSHRATTLLLVFDGIDNDKMSPFATLNVLFR